MTVTDVQRAPKPDAPRGMVFAAMPVPSGEWRVAETVTPCRWTSPGVPQCGEPAVAEKHIPNNPIAQWRGYCAVHASAAGRNSGYGHWVENGTVMTWELRREDGTVPSAAEVKTAHARTAAGMTDWCKAHRCPKAECRPESTHPKPVRFRTDTWDDVEDAARQGKTYAAALVTAAVDVMLGYTPCTRCNAAIVLKRGDFADVTAADAVRAVEQAKRQRCKDHHPVLVGAETAPAATGPAAVFRAGPDVDCLHENFRGVKGVCPDCKQWVGGKR